MKRGGKLSVRLTAIADLVPPGTVVADVGCDHALLLRSLLARGGISRGIGIDIHEGPLVLAAQHVEEFGPKAELRRGNGLQPLCAGEASTIVIAGMGGARICSILEERPALVADSRCVVLQPNTDWADVRRYIARTGHHLGEETMVHDRGQYYLVLALWPAHATSQTWDDADFEFGHLLRRRQPPPWRAWLAEQQRDREELRAKLESQPETTSRRERIEEIDRWLSRLHHALP